MTHVIKLIIIGALFWVTLAQAGPLHDAARSGDIAEISRLLEEGEKINERNARGQTPLHIAAAMGHTDLITFLITAGADINAKDKRGLTALNLAAERNLIDVARILLNAGATG